MNIQDSQAGRLLITLETIKRLAPRAQSNDSVPHGEFVTMFVLHAAMKQQQAEGEKEGQSDGQGDRLVGGQGKGQSDGQADRLAGGQGKGRTDGQGDRLAGGQGKGRTDGQADRLAGEQGKGQSDGQADRLAGEQGKGRTDGQVRGGACPGLMVSRLSELLQVSRPTASQMVSTLEEKGYIKRVMSETDRRVIYICLTDKGQEVFGDRMERYANAITEVIEKVGREDIDQLISTCGRLVEAVNEIRPRLLANPALEQRVLPDTV